MTDGFWSIRGHFKIAGIVDIGTQMSLVRQRNGRFVALDSYSLAGQVLQDVKSLTDDGALLDAIINLHPYHTLHCRALSECFPNAKLYGTRRHKAKWPDLDWQEVMVNDERFAALFPELKFSCPRGVEFIAPNEHVHFSSVLAYHPASGTLHVDDTLMYLDAGFPLSLLVGKPKLAFHPTLGKALSPRSGAARDFRSWVLEIAREFKDTETVCTAHNAILHLEAGTFPAVVNAALQRVEGTLAKHEQKCG